MFKKLIRERRCLILANCYYEWKQTKIGKTPYCIRMEDESPFSSAACVTFGTLGNLTCFSRSPS